MNQSNVLLQTSCVNELNALFPHIQDTLFSGLFCKNKLNEPLDSLIFGFFIGFLSSKKEIKITDVAINGLLQIFNDTATKIKQFENLLQLLAVEMTNYLYQTKEIESNSNDQHQEKEQQLIININDVAKEKEIVQCSICSSEYDIFNESNYDLNCGCIIHETCFDNHVLTQISTKQIPIDCPLCKMEIEPNIIIDSLNKIDSELVKTYEQLTLDNYMQQSDDVRNCPTSGCDYLFCFDDDDTEFICPKCSKAYCLKCHCDWHEDKTCAKYQRMMIEKKNPKPVSDKKNVNYKKCPFCLYWNEYTVCRSSSKYSRRIVERFIVCRSCSVSICLECGEKYEKHHTCNYAHMPDRKIFNHDNHKGKVKK